MAFLKNPPIVPLSRSGRNHALLWQTALAFVLGAFMLFYRLGDLPLIAPDEGRNAEVAREMNLSGEWLAPTYLGATYLDKPAFYFKTVALSFAAFGESEATARLSSAAFGFFLLIALFLFCRRIYDGPTAAAAVAVVATTPLYMAFSRLVIFDMTLAFFVCSAIFACYLAEEHQDARRNYWYLTGALAAGIATLVKGPVGFLLPSLVISIFFWVDGRRDAIGRCFAWPQWILFFAVVLPWFVGLSLECPDFPYYGIMKESLSRFASKEFHRSKPFYFYAVIIATCFLAWSLLLPESIAAAWRGRNRLSRGDRLFIVWSLVVVGFFSISQSKLPGYILTAVVALGVLTARVFVEAWRNPQGKAAPIVGRGTAALALLSAAAAIFTLGLILQPETMKQGFRLKDELFAIYRPAFPVSAASLAFIALIAAGSLLAGSPRLAFVSFLAFPLLLLTANFSVLTAFTELKSSRPLAERVSLQAGEDAEIACLECLPNGLPFYLKQPVTVLSKDGAELSSNYVLYSLSSGKPWPERIVPVDNRDEWLASRTHPVYLLAAGNRYPMLREIAARYGASVNDASAGYFSALLPSPKVN